MKNTLLLIILLFPFISFSQHYTITGFHDQYEEIKDYKSIMKETKGDLGWANRFELNFEFPFFEYSFDHFNCDTGGLCYFDGDINFTLRLFTFGYQCDNVWDTINITSDVRYKYLIKDEKKALVIQFTKNRLHSDPSVEEYDSYINFQWWFFDNGTIEIRFGPSNLDNSPVYVPGEGFYLLTNVGPLPSGPEVALYHPSDEAIKIAYNDLDSYENYEINHDNTGTVDWMPAEGWVIRFENDLVSTKKEEIVSDIRIYPNPVTDILNIESGKDIETIQIKNMDGKTLYSYEGVNSINVSDLSSGMYILQTKTSNSIIISKFIKI